MDFWKLLDDLGINLRVVGVQVVIFVTTFIVLSRLLFGRVLVFMKTREEEQGSAAERIRRNREDVARLTAEYGAKIAQVEKEAYAELQGVLKEALGAKEKIIAGAQQQAKAEMDSARTAIVAEKSAAMAQLRAEVARLARSAAEKILQEAVHRPNGQSLGSLR